MDALDLSKYIVTKCIKDGKPITNLHLQKILYYIQKEFLKVLNKRAFYDEIEAWQFGPVVPNVYYTFCIYGALPIDIKFDINELQIDNIDTVNEIVEEKRKLDPWDMVRETHEEGGAWAKTYKDGDGNHEIIDINMIKSLG